MSIASKQESKQATEKASSSNRAAATATKSRYLNASHSSPPFFKGNEKQNDFRCRFVFVTATAKCVQV